MDSERVLVFAGPTLARTGGRLPFALPSGCALRPPIRRGDVLEALAEHPETLVLLDGYYYTVQAVTHKEILYALDAGVRVIGAASLGALRAAELAPFGMIGVGRVFADFRDGRLDGDDEVALLHAPAEQGYRPLTVALVEVRHALPAITGADDLLAVLKNLPFMDRTPQRLEELARHFLGEPAAGELLAALGRPGVKEADAREALALAAAPAPAQPRKRRLSGRYLTFDKEAAVRAPGSRVTVMDAWRMAQLLHPGAVRFVRRLRLRALLASAELRSGREPSAEQLRERAEALRRLQVERFGRPLLPWPEIEEEARTELLAAAAASGSGGVRGALRSLASVFGIGRRVAARRLHHLFVEQPDLLPGWWAARAFSFTRACVPALRTAEEAREVHACFLRRWGGARIVREDLWQLAADLWGCAPAAVPAEGARRGLFPGFALSDGLREAIEKIAAAERLPEPINSYPEWARRLAGTALPLEGPGGTS